MDCIKWKYRQLKQWLIYFFMYHAHWKKIWLSESDNANWEIRHDSKTKEITLMYVPKDDYSKKDIEIKVPYEQFEDLVKFIIRIS